MRPPATDSTAQPPDGDRTITVLGIRFRAAPMWLALYFLSVGALAVAAICHNVSSPFWLDETFTGAVSCQPSVSAMMPLILHDAHPVLYHVMVHLMFGVIGCHLWAVRALSLAASLMASLILLRHVERRGGDVFLAAALMFANPTFWFYAFEARSYSLLFLAGAGVVSYGLSSDTSSRIKAIGFALLGGLLHYYASFLFLLLLILVLSGDRIALKSRRFWIGFFAAGLALSVYYAPQLSEGMSYGKTLQWILPPSAVDLFIGFPSRLFGSPVSAAVMILMIVPIVIRHGSPVGRPLLDQAFALIAVFVLFVLCVFGASYLRPMFVYRYMHFMVPALIIGVALLAGDRERSSNGKRGPEAEFARKILAGTIFFSLANVYFCVGFSTDDRAMGWQKAMASLSCTVAQPCGFVLDDPLLPSLDAAQYTTLANFLAAVPGSFVTVNPWEALSWIEKNPGRQLLYVESFRPSISLQRLIDRVPLKCEDFRSGRIGAVTCRSLAPSPPKTGGK